MKKILAFSLLLTTTLTTPLLARTKGVYGIDDRQEYSSLSSFHKKLSGATATQVRNKNIENTVKNGWRKVKRTIRRMCSGENFEGAASLGSCSGFLITPELLVTAGHCIKTMEDCNNNSWVFNYNDTRELKRSVKASDVYKCKEIIARKFDNKSKLDYAIIRLKTANTSAAPVKMRLKDKIATNQPLLLIGYPSGLILKATFNGAITNNSIENYFITDLDAFKGNSGSSVFNQQSGLLEGILVRGATDYYKDEVNNCMRIQQCAKTDINDKNCWGEDVVRISKVISEIPPVEFASYLLEKGDNKRLKEFISTFVTNINAHDSKRNTIAHLLLYSKNIELIKFIFSQPTLDLAVRNSLNYNPLELLASQVKVMPKLLPLFKEKMKNNLELLNIQGSGGETILSTAINDRNSEVFKYLLSLNDIDLSLKLKSGKSYFDLALESAEDEMQGDYGEGLALLYQMPGVDPKVELSSGKLVASALLSYDRSDIVLPLVEQGLLNGRELDFSQMLLSAYIDGQDEFVLKLINTYSADLNFDYQQDVPFLKKMILEQRYDLFAKIIKDHTYLNFNFNFEDGQTPLLYFIEHGRADFAEYFIDHYFEMVAERDDYGTSAVDAIILAGIDNPEISGLLISAVLSPRFYINDVDRFGQGPLIIAASNGLDDTVDTLLMLSGIDIHLKANDGFNAALYAAMGGHWNIFEELVSLGSDTSLTNDNGDHLLFYAVHYEKSDLFKKYWGTYSFDCNTRYNNRELGLRGASLIHYSMETSQYDIAKTLITSRQCDLNIRMDNGDGAIHQAIRDGNLSMVKLLLENGANPKLKGANNITPKKLANALGEKAIRKLITKSLWKNIF